MKQKSRCCESNGFSFRLTWIVPRSSVDKKQAKSGYHRFVAWSQILAPQVFIILSFVVPF